MNLWNSVLLVGVTGLVRKIINSLLTDNGFIRSIRVNAIWYPAFAAYRARLFAPAVLVTLLLIPKLSKAIAGIEGTFEYAFDAPWRIEPSVSADGSLTYGDIPIQLSIHDAMFSDRDLNTDLPRGSAVDRLVRAKTILGNVCDISIRESLPGGQSKTLVMPFEEFTEVEATWGVWKPPARAAAPPKHSICRHGEQSSCAAFRDLSRTSEWHSLVWYRPRQEMKAGTIIPLAIEMRVTRDPSQPCLASSAGTMTLTNAVRVYLGDDRLPRFGTGWLYGDLHYHSQGSDNEGESGYNFRGVVRALGALGMDFVFATDHASNSDQIVDSDLSLEQLQNETGTLRDMSAQRFRSYHDLIYGKNGVNEWAAVVTGNGKPSQSFQSHGVIPQLFLGGEIDIIPEVAVGFPQWKIPYGNGLQYNLMNLCGGWKSALASGGPCAAASFIWEYAASTNDYLIHDIQGLNDEDYGRLHLVYLPEKPHRDAFVASDTGKYGGASRRLDDVHRGKPSMLSDVERYGYAFIAHPMVAPKPGTNGPDSVPWSDHLLKKAWASRAILGLEFWNEDARLRDNLQPADETGYTRSEGFLGWASGERVPTDNLRDGFKTGNFELYPHHYLKAIWDKDLIDVEKTLAHGAYTWDRMNQWGLNVIQTSALSWLKPGEPRKFFMAGGSDAHGDLNYRRNGYFLGTTNLTDTAIGKPRNLVNAGRPISGFEAPDSLDPVATDTSIAADSASVGLNPVVTVSPPATDNSWSRPTAPDSDTVTPVELLPDAVPHHSQSQIVAALVKGQFSITDGPALRIVADRNKNGRIDDSDTPMGGIVNLYGEKNLPLLVQWKSTPEFGPVTAIDLYVGVDSSDSNISTSGRLYAPVVHGPHLPRRSGAPSTDIVSTYKSTSNGRTYSLMEDHYWRDPTGLQRIGVADGSYEGIQAVTLNLDAYELNGGRKGNRFFVRAFARTDVLSPTGCKPVGLDPDTLGSEDTMVRPGETQRVRESDFTVPARAKRSGLCIRRYAFTNPIWAIQQIVQQCPSSVSDGIDGDGDGLPDGCDPCPASKINVCVPGPLPWRVGDPSSFFTFTTTKKSSFNEKAYKLSTTVADDNGNADNAAAR